MIKLSRYWTLDRYGSESFRKTAQSYTLTYHASTVEKYKRKPHPINGILRLLLCHEVINDKVIITFFDIQNDDEFINSEKGEAITKLKKQYPKIYEVVESVSWFLPEKE
jgi:hypothetical protein